MPMNMEQFDKILGELVSEGTTEGRKSVILSELRKDYTSGLNQMKEMVGQTDKLKEEKDLLQETNVKLFKQVGRDVYGFQYGEDKQPKPFSQTITLEAIEKANKRY